MISIMLLSQNMLSYGEVFTKINFVNIATTPLEMGPKILILREKDKNDLVNGEYVGSMSDCICRQVIFCELHHYTESGLMLL